MTGTESRSTDIYFDRDQIHIPQGAQVNVSGRPYTFKRGLDLHYINHQGASAGLLVRDPVDQGKYLSFSSILEDGDILESANELALALATRLSSLQARALIKEDDEARKKEMLTSAERKEKEVLEAMLEAA